MRLELPPVFRPRRLRLPEPGEPKKPPAHLAVGVAVELRQLAQRRDQRARRHLLELFRRHGGDRRRRGHAGDVRDARTGDDHLANRIIILLLRVRLLRPGCQRHTQQSRADQPIRSTTGGNAHFAPSSRDVLLMMGEGTKRVVWLVEPVRAGRISPVRELRRGGQRGSFAAGVLPVAGVQVVPVRA